jgi:hypothetical protein
MLGQLKFKLNETFANVAAGIAPGMQSALSQINAIDLGPFNLKLEDAFLGISGTIQQQKIGELLELSMKTGIQGASNFMLDQIELWGTKVREALGKAGDHASEAGFWKKLGAGTLGVGAGLLGLWDELGASLHVPGANERADEKIEFAEKMFGIAGLDDGLISQMATKLAKSPAGKRGNPFLAQLTEFLDQAAQGVKLPGAAACAWAPPAPPNPTPSAASVSSPATSAATATKARAPRRETPASSFCKCELCSPRSSSR